MRVVPTPTLNYDVCQMFFNTYFIVLERTDVGRNTPLMMTKDLFRTFYISINRYIDASWNRVKRLSAVFDGDGRFFRSLRSSQDVSVVGCRR